MGTELYQPQTAANTKDIKIIKKVALIIGNSEYLHSPLVNPINDAVRMRETLEEFGFEVIFGLDLTQQQMRQKIASFKSALVDAEVGLFFFAGHGVQDAGINYLIPVLSGIRATPDLQTNAISAAEVLRTMEQSDVTTSVIILDACRNNPLPDIAMSRSLGDTNADRGIQVGLAKMDAPTGSIIVYSTAPGKTASDGRGDNGLFTGHLLKNMTMPGASIYDVAMATRRSVMEESKGAQVPWELSSLIQPFYFQPSANQSQIMFSNANQPNYLQSGKVPLSIFTLPEESSIEFVKGDKAFEQGMLLAPKEYKIRITAEGFETMERTIDLREANAFEFVLDQELNDEYFTVDDVNFNMKAIPGAEFDFGCGNSRKCPENSLSHRKELYINSFRLMDTEVTWDLYQLCIEDGNCDEPQFGIDHLSEGMPMSSVSYFDVTDDFIPWLNYKTGQTFRLPNETEWEYVAKAHGRKQSCEYAHTAKCNNKVNGRTKYQARIAGDLKPNDFGLYNLYGNLEEMVADCFTKAIDDIPSDGSPYFYSSCRSHVVRGSDYTTEKYRDNVNTRSAY